MIFCTVSEELCEKPISGKKAETNITVTRDSVAHLFIREIFDVLHKMPEKIGTIKKLVQGYFVGYVFQAIM